MHEPGADDGDSPVSANDFGHEAAGKRSRGLLVRVTDGDCSEEFFVQNRLGGDPSISLAAPPSRHDEDWLAAAREYLHERALHDELSSGDSAESGESERSGVETGAKTGVAVAAAIVAGGLVALYLLLQLYPLSGDPLSFGGASVGVNVNVFNAMAVDILGYLVFAGGALAVVREGDRIATLSLAAAVFVSAVVVPSAFLLARGVDSAAVLSVSRVQAAVFPTAATVGFHQAHRIVTRDATSVPEADGHRLVSRVTAVVRRFQQVYARFAGNSSVVAKPRTLRVAVRRTLLTTGIAATLVGGVVFLETLQSGWTFATQFGVGTTDLFILVVASLLRIGAGIVVTTLVLTGLVLAVLWLAVRPPTGSSLLFAVVVFTGACGLANLSTAFLVPTPVGLTASWSVEWGLVPPRPGRTVVWLLDLLNVQMTLVLVGFAAGVRSAN